MATLIPTQATSYTISTNDTNYLLREGEIISSSGNGILISNTVSDVNVTVSGTIFVDGDGVRLGTNATAGEQNILTVSASGDIFGASDGVEVFSTLSGVFNYGSIFGEGDAGIQLVSGSNDSFVVNSGSISSRYVAVLAESNNASITNDGQISGIHGINVTGSNARIFNTGTIAGNLPTDPNFQFRGTEDSIGVRLSNTGAVFNNSGFVWGLDYSVLATGAAGDTRIINSGEMIGDVETTSGEDVLRNTGEIDGLVFLGSGADLAINSGTMDGLVLMGDGDDRLINGGQINGDVDLSANNDVYRALGDGAVTGTINGGSGDDTITGGSAADEIYGDSDEDILRGGAGDDNVFGGTANDRVFGGVGNDNVYGEDGDDVVGGDDGDDNLFGQDGADRLFGGRGDDFLYGGLLDDRLFGGAGNDTLEGSLGRDQFYGGEGNDTFVFTNVNDSPDSQQRDIIFDFTAGEDVINVTQLAGPAFDFIGTAAFSGTGGEVRYQAIATGTNVLIDVDGDGTGDMRIFLDGVSTLTADDFIL